MLFCPLAREFLDTCEPPELLKLRVEMLAEGNCDPFAINLADWCLKCDTMKGDETLILLKLLLLSKQGRKEEALNMVWMVNYSTVTCCHYFMCNIISLI